MYNVLPTATTMLCLVVACISLPLVIAQYRTPRSPDGIERGSDLSLIPELATVSWRQHRATIVMVLSTTCKYCTDSAPFYKRVISEAAKAGVGVVAVFPQSVEGSTEYLVDLELAVPTVRSTTLAALGVRGTPTLLLADRAGRVQSSWLGTLDQSAEQELIAAAFGGPDRAATSHSSPWRTISVSGLYDVVKSPDRVTLVDSRHRNDYNAMHIDGFINMPSDEMDARARHEIAPHDAVVLFCDYCSTCTLNRLSDPSALCDVSVRRLRGLGFAEVSVADGSLAMMRDAGLPLLSTPRP